MSPAETDEPIEIPFGRQTREDLGAESDIYDRPVERWLVAELGRRVRDGDQLSTAGRQLHTARQAAVPGSPRTARHSGAPRRARQRRHARTARQTRSKVANTVAPRIYFAVIHAARTVCGAQDLCNVTVSVRRSVPAAWADLLLLARRGGDIDRLMHGGAAASANAGSAAFTADLGS